MTDHNTPDTPVTRVSVSTAAELIAAVPALMGCHPGPGVVIVALRATKVVVVAAPPVEVPDEAIVAEVRALITSTGADHLHVVVIGGGDPLCRRALVDRLGHTAVDADLSLDAHWVARIAADAEYRDYADPDR